MDSLKIEIFFPEISLCEEEQDIYITLTLRVSFVICVKREPRFKLLQQM